jgi:site-specific recombinase XerD
LSPATIEFYEYTSGKFVEWLISINITEPERIRSSHIRKYLSLEKEKGITDSSIHGRARGIRAFFNFVYEEGYIIKPIKVTMPRVAKKRLPVLSSGEHIEATEVRFKKEKRRTEYGVD